MLGLFKKKKGGPYRPLMTGRLETSYEDLRLKFGSSLAGRIYSIDIGNELGELPEYARLPKKVQQLVRNVLDDYLKAGEEFYFQLDEKVFGLFFSRANVTVAELKVRAIRNELSRVIKEAKRKKDAVSETKPLRTRDVNLKGRGMLSSRPDEAEMREWANRALANMTTQHGYEDLYADVYKLAQMVRVEYAPVWFVKNRIVSGYMARPTASITRAAYSERQAHEDLAILGAAIRQLKEMRARSEYALVVVPACIQTICQKSTRDLYNIYCRGLDDELKKFIVLRLKGLDRITPSQSDWEALKGLAWHCRSVIVDTGLKKINPKKIETMKFHSYGFDLSNIGAPENQLFGILDSYAAYYQSYKKEMFLLGIETPSVLAAALGAGFSYLSGPAVLSPLATPKRAAFLSLHDVYGHMIPA